MVSNFTGMGAPLGSFFFFFFFNFALQVRSVIFPKMMIYKTDCLHALDLIY